ncbi:(p)ppGpp synthase/HD superfamily hydrolase [Paenibacillus phyllosphaerae]|uniref:(P)ppGpp synthase/HD superfamily hydrolase n=1 Tax=Paenibacillus phyllosphaerae TaxID=274593 RepID=A0A7W5FNH7_9BACL|nr:bifunctional (p)ppGpp synthetase/guanosine-3',5'-bis(diphosphate) 3'-pyrophosphohydrolase [Paenibacillus phyllosphaerae]MBB3111193.1 (p)ppGpp synthase/HD superfamily hydrolase [Paenibacillus phyllosphaerae]
MSTLAKAIEIAAQAHGATMDRNGQPYILHPIRVMLDLDSEDERIVGVLHDVIEDTDLTLGDLRNAGFAPHIVDAVDSVTRREPNGGEQEDYFDFVRRAKGNEIGRQVKLADLRDNMDWSRIQEPTEKDMKRMQKYEQAYYMLLS